MPQYIREEVYVCLKDINSYKIHSTEDLDYKDPENTINIQMRIGTIVSVKYPKKTNIHQQYPIRVECNNQVGYFWRERDTYKYLLDGESSIFESGSVAII